MIKTPKRIADAARNYRFHGLFIKNFITSALLIMLPLITLNVFLYRSMGRFAISEASMLSLNTLHQTRDVFDAIFKEGEYLAASIALRSDTEVYMLTDNFNDILTQNAVHAIAANLKTAVYSNAFIHTIYVFSEASDRVITHIGENDRSGFLDSGWYRAYFNIGENKIYKVFRTIDNNYPYVISLIKPLYLFGPGQKYGAIVINFDIDQLKQILIDTDPNSLEDLYVIGSDGIILFGNYPDELGKKADAEKLKLISGTNDISVFEKGIKADPRIVSVCPSLRYPWHYLSYHALGTYTLQSSRLQSLISIAIIISVFATVLSAFLISTNSYRPIKRILSVIEQPERIQLLQQSGGRALSNETKYIAAAIARFAHTNRELNEELNKQLNLLDRARLATLQSQISPHFINNTLEVISMSARRLSPGDNQVVTMISLLSRLLRIGLDPEHNIVPLTEEVEYARLYLRILSIRYQNRFDVNWNIDEGLLQTGVLKLCLQPLLENAFYHGIKPIRKKGSITIRICRKGDEMVITVTDTGRGIPAKSVTRLNKSLSADFEISGEHVGMRNVNQRIKLIFGLRYGISIESSRTEGTTVKMLIPAVHRPETD